MKWFGKNWGAPICENPHTPTPVGTPCYLCEDKPIQEGDRGVVMPFCGNPGDPPELAAHLRCFLLSVTTSKKEDIDAWLATLPGDLPV